MMKGKTERSTSFTRGSKKKTGKIIMYMVFAFLLLGAVGYGLTYVPDDGKPFIAPINEDVLGKPLFTAQSLLQKQEPYGRMLSAYAESGYSDYEGNDIIIDGMDYSNSKGKVENKTILGNQAAVSEGIDSFLEWSILVPESALYEIDIRYLALAGKNVGVERSLTIDGTSPFDEASRLLFPRLWTDDPSLSLDNQGNEIRSPQTEKAAWQTKSFDHPEGFYKRPYKFYLTAGTHVLRLTDIKEPMAISRLTLKKPTALPTYGMKKAEYLSAGYKAGVVEIIKKQAEHPVGKSEMSLRSEWSNDPLSEPNATKNIIYNTFGGDRWKRGGQSVTWELDVPADGLYQLAFRYMTPAFNTASYRTLLIDGEIPFAEMEEYAFPFVKGWRTEAVKDPAHTPYQFYLTKGKHRLTLVSKVGPLRETVFQINEVANMMNELSRQVVQVTAATKDATGKITSDKYQDWDLEAKISNLMETLKTAKQTIANISDAVVEANGNKRPNYMTAFSSMSHLLDGMIKDTETIPYQLNELSTALGALGSAITNITEQPLFIDYIAYGDPSFALPRGASTYGENLIGIANQFIYSFREDGSQVGDVYKQSNGDDQPVLNVWVARGREWVSIVKDLIDEDFTPKTGIQVNINTVPMGSEHLLLLAYTADKAPDVALGVSPQTPVEFAIRNALVDLNQFPDLQTVKERFVKSAFIPYEYNNGLFALPETQDFQMMFYREDIFDSLGIEPPQTWKDVYKILPILQEYEMEFYYPDGAGGYSPFLFQRGGDFYTEHGLKSALDTSEALYAFKEWTDLMNNYKLPLKADFYQRFRTGQMPVGIAGYDLYVRLMTAAPELSGLWKMAPIPGILRDDGGIDRSTGGSGQTGVILASSRHKEASWELLKWWTEENTQIRYGIELEGLLGAGSRWNTANVEAMKGMAWSKEELAAILEQWSWFKEQPVVLGGYYTSRHLMNAWNRTVITGDNARIALEDAYKEINKELLRKQEEFAGKKGSGKEREAAAQQLGEGGANG
ncbi:extracellular solute-binding protein [Paenibacillus sp. PAMC21692]|uniref:extracellular solute-binding protein n=1 Tax=Paenibacillus sp. PAMC21692 TaxID=2762320 RepID=UPI00164E12D1|nr:extracellular solute-binding protein [Paenibacillus sp. PAMC21692]QNK59514.1 extracellular solute-binding protein [Paenibacillus sp. PAMC21692]